jgi:hypothetical protein
MKALEKLVFTFLCLFWSFAGHTQVWFDFGINTGINTGFFLAKGLPSNVPQLGNSVAFKIGINPSEVHSVVIELGHAWRGYGMEYANIPGQDPNQEFNSTLQFTSFQTALLYRKITEGSFLEVGPMFSSTLTETTNDVLNSQINDNIVQKNIYRGVIGVGGFLLGNERVTLVAGLRLLYDFSDIRSTYAKDNLYPLHPYTNPAVIPSLRAFDVQVNLELNVSLGYLYRASCGKRSVVFEL